MNTKRPRPELMHLYFKFKSGAWAPSELEDANELCSPAQPAHHLYWYLQRGFILPHDKRSQANFYRLSPQIVSSCDGFNLMQTPQVFVELYNSGTTYNEIGRRYSMSSATVRKVILSNLDIGSGEAR